MSKKILVEKSEEFLKFLYLLALLCNKDLRRLAWPNTCT